jgi:hypothetical protein
MRVLALILFPILMWSQECSPYHNIPTYKLSNNKSGGIGYVACLHAKGVVAEVGYDKLFVGVLAMGQGHHGATYSFLQYEFAIRELRIYGGPAYRLNHNPSLIIGRVGIDVPIYKRLYTTASILQINKNLNYLHVGLKLVI